MFERFDRSMKLFSASWHVLREDKALAVYPFVSAITGLIIMATFAVPVLTMYLHTSTTTDAFGRSHLAWHLDPLGWVLAGVGYFVLIYVGIFCNAALIYAANERLTGTGPGTVASGFSGAAARAGAFVPWALVSATVTLVLRALEERLGILGRIVIGIVGIAWTLVTYLVVPVLVLEGVPTGKAISRSTQLFKGTWGENVIGNVGFGFFNFCVVLSAMALFVLGVMAGTATAVIVCGVLAAVWMLVASEVLVALAGIYRVALYRYAVDGVAPSAYTMFDFDAAFRPRARSGIFGFGSSSPSKTVYLSQLNNARPPGAPHKAWQPPPSDPVTDAAAFGISIPGAEDPFGAPSPQRAAPTAQPSPAPEPQNPWGDAAPPSPRGF
jgi:hypothetical protein